MPAEFDHYGNPTMYTKFQFMQSSAAHVVPGTQMQLRQTINYPKLVAVDPTIPKGAESMIYYTGDFHGEVTRISIRGQDIKLVQSMRTQHQVAIERYATGWEYAEHELERAIEWGEDMPMDKSPECLRVTEEYKEDVFLWGEEGTGWDSFLANPKVPTYAVPKQQAWGGPNTLNPVGNNFDISKPTENLEGAMSGQDIFRQLNTWLLSIVQRTGRTRIPNTIVFPPEHMTMLSNPWDRYSDTTIMDYFMANNIITRDFKTPLNIHTLPELSTVIKDPKGSATQNGKDYDGGVEGRVIRTLDRAEVKNSDIMVREVIDAEEPGVLNENGYVDNLKTKTGVSRIIAYCKNMECLRFHIPEELRFRAPERDKMTYKIYGLFTLGGLEVREPTTFSYLDGT